MKKKFLALAALLCSATVCATVGAAVMNNNVQTVSAEATTTWTDTATGKKYTFEGNYAEQYGNIKATDIGDLVPTEYQLPLATENGISGEAVAVSGTSPNGYLNPCMIRLENQDWVKESGGVYFQFKTDDAWYTPAGLNGTTQTAASTLDQRIEVYYGDLRVFLIRTDANYDAADNEIKLQVYNQTSGKMLYEKGANQASLFNYFSENTQTGRYDMNQGWGTLLIRKYKCTAVDGDASAASGYWLKIRLGKPGEALSNWTTLVDLYVDAPMYNDTYDNFAIRNATMGVAGAPAYTITESGYENYQNRLHIRRGDGVVKATVATESYKDVAELTTENKPYADKFTMGWNTSSTTQWRLDETYDFLSGSSDRALGLEFRTKHTDTIVKNAAAAVGAYAEVFMILSVGTSSIYVDYNATNGLRFTPLNEANASTNVLTGFRDYTFLINDSIEYNPDKEYAWRITSSPVTYTDGNTSMDGKGSMVRIYFGEVDETTGMPAADWADKPIYEYYDPNVRTSTNANKVGLMVENAKVGNSTAHTMTFSSNQYVGVKTIVGDTVTVNAVERNGNYTLADLTSDTMLHIGWSKGASEYSADDFVAKNTTITVKESATYTALALKMNADKTADLRFRKRAENNNELEISLQWDVSSEDIGNVGYYFGNITYGYKITSNNGKNSGDVDCMELLTTDGVSAPYAYSVIQSGITDSDMEFTFQAYVKFMVEGKVFAIAYTAETDMATYGTSVKDVATAALTDEAYAELTAEEQALIQAKAQ